MTLPRQSQSRVTPGGQSPSRGNWWGRAFRLGGPFLLFFLIALAIQFGSGAFKGEAGHYHDEAAHFVSALMGRDYVYSGFEATPRAYAEEYYLHYPKLGLGIFPPLFHTLLAAWLLIGPGSYAAALIFMAAVTAGIAWLVFRSLLSEYGITAAATAGILAISLPLMRELSAAVMVDTMVALFGLLVMIYTARFLESGATRDAALMGLAAAAGCLVKGNGVGAVLCPAFAIVFTGRYSLLRRPGPYIAAAIWLALAAPAQWMSLSFYDKNASFHEAGLSWWANSARLYGQGLVRGMGVLVAVAMVIGLARMVWQRVRDSRQGMLEPSAAALLAGTLLFHISIPHNPAERYLTTAVATGVLFVPFAFRGLPKGALTAGIGLLAAVALLGVSPAPTMGYREMTDLMEKEPDYASARILVIADALGEGALIGEIASRDQPRPQHMVVRGSKLLARSDWNSSYYNLRMSDPEAALRHLEDLGIKLMVVDETIGIARALHQDLVDEIVGNFKERALFVGRLGATDGVRTRSLALYRLTAAAEQPRVKLKYYLDSTIGGSVEY